MRDGKLVWLLCELCMIMWMYCVYCVWLLCELLLWPFNAMETLEYSEEEAVYIVWPN